MDDQLMTAAKTLARWCYGRGVDERILTCGDQLLKKAVDQAIGRPAPPHLEHALWQQTATLLRQRRDWDRDHQVTPPPAAACLPCAVAAEQCPPTPVDAVAPAVASCTASSSTRATTPIRAATAQAPPVPTPSSSTRRSCWAPRRWPSLPEPGPTRLPRSSAAGDRLDPRPTHR